MVRSYGRSPYQMRPLKITRNSFGYSDASVLFELGNTKVLCTVSLAHGVPHFLKNKKSWWLTASYGLLPHATHVRNERESINKRNERSIEISRLIGRSLRSVITLDDKLTEKTIHVDCDVLQADGGTRTASITAASIALHMAQARWLEHGEIKVPIIQERIAGISLGLLDNQILLDLDYQEDSKGQSDFNFIVTQSSNLVEVQGCAEQMPVSWDVLHRMYMIACAQLQPIFALAEQIEQKADTVLFELSAPSEILLHSSQHDSLMK